MKSGHVAAIAVGLGLWGCGQISPQMIRVGAAKDEVYLDSPRLEDYTASSIAREAELELALARIVELYNYSIDMRWHGANEPLPANAANFLHGPQSMVEFGAGIATLGYKTMDLSQSSADQTGFNPSESQPVPISPEICRLARELNVKRPHVPHASDHAALDYGNPPRPTFVSAWFPVPRSYAGVDADMSAATDPLAEDCGELCLHAGVALQEQPAPTILVVHGIFDSSNQHYIQSTGATLFSLGYNVVTVDLRDHGATLAAYPDVTTTMGVLEASDLLQVAQHVRTKCAPIYDSGSETAESISDWKVGALGFSFGGRAVMDAYLHPSGTKVLDGGALAVSPPLDMRRAIEWFEVTRYSAFRWRKGRLRTPALRGTGIVDLLSPTKVEALLQQAIVLYFSSLVDLRWSSVLANSEPKPDDRGSACDYTGARLRTSYPGRLGIEDVILERDYDAMAGQLAAFDSGSAPPLAIVESRDDPVVVWDLHVENSGRGFQRYLGAKARLLAQSGHPVGANACVREEPEASAEFDIRTVIEGTDSVLMYALERGGHISYAGVSQPLARCFLRTYFGRSTGRSESERRCSYASPSDPAIYHLGGVELHELYGDDDRR